MKAHRITAGGNVQFHVVETGNQRGRPILFLQGVSQSSLSWDLQMNSSLADSHRLIAMDLRGHGLSDKPYNAYTDSKLWADDINAVIQSLNLDHPVLSGWSYGPLVFLDYIRHYGEDQIGGLQFVGGVTKLGSPEAMSVLTPEFLNIVPQFLSNDAETVARGLEGLLRLCFARCACVSLERHRLPSCISCWDIAFRSPHMSARGCSRDPSITTTYCRKSASRC